MQRLVQNRGPCVTYWTSQWNIPVRSADGRPWVGACVPWRTGDRFRLRPCSSGTAGIDRSLRLLVRRGPCVSEVFIPALLFAPAGLSLTAVFSAAPSVQSWQMCSGTDVTRPNLEPWSEIRPSNPSFASPLSHTPH